MDLSFTPEQEAFREEVARVNRLLASYNLSVPAYWQQVRRLSIDQELSRALHEAPQRAKELRTERGSRRARDAAAPPVNLNGAAASGGVVFGATPSFAVSKAAFPSIFEALASALLSRP